MLLDSSTDMAFPYLGAAGRYVSSEGYLDRDRNSDSGAHVSLALSIVALCVSALCLLAAVYSRSSPNQHSSSHDNSSHSSSALDENQQGEQLQASVNPLRSSGDKYGYAKI